MEDIQLGDIVEMRKPHPCGSRQWTVIRTGADIKIRCQVCQRIVMMDRETFVKRRRMLLERPGANLPNRANQEGDGTL